MITWHGENALNYRSYYFSNVPLWVQIPHFWWFTTGSANVSLDLGGQSLRARITLASLNELDLRPGNQVFALIKSVTFDGR